MKKYEYKVVRFSTRLGFDFDKKCKDLERIWNELGRQGWRFRARGHRVFIFEREISRNNGNSNC